ncbi:MAG: dihydrofolate reductase family protein [Bacillota bacterium]
MSYQSRVLFYGAISVDGYLAREDHSLDWLIGTEGEEDTTYQEFYDSIDTIVMGRKTYEQILILSPDEFPYSGKECYVFSRTMTGSNENVTFINEDVAEFTKSLKSQKGKRIWLVGGGEVLDPALKEKLVDEFIIQIAPSIIGRGISLFIPGDHENRLKLLDVRRYKQFAEMHYETIR